MAKKESTNQVSSHQKGKELEHDFARFMKDELGWQKARIIARMPGRRNIKGSDIDVLGERPVSGGKSYRKIMLLIFSVLGVVLAVLTCAKSFGIEDYDLSFTVPGLICCVVFLLYYSNEARFTKLNAWAECKNWRGKVGIEDVRTSFSQYEDYRLSSKKKYNFIVHYFVSANGFTEGALRFAEESGIICITKENGQFEIIEYL